MTDDRWSAGRARRTVVAILATATIGVLGWPHVAADASMPLWTTEEVSGLHFLSNVCGTEIEQAGTISTTVHDLGDGHVVFDIRVDIVLSADGRLAFERPAFTAEIDPDAGTVTLEGTLVNISAPAEGILLKDVGRVVRELSTNDILTIVGRWMVLDGDFARVCAYFSSPPPA
jgi:hypothetical protein